MKSLRKIKMVAIVVSALALFAGCGPSQDTIDKVASSARKISKAMAEVNTTRHAVGLPDVWPRTPGSSLVSSDKDDISGKSFNNAREYIIELLDWKNWGTDRWASYVDVDVCVFGFARRELESCYWIVAANVTDEMESFIPVFVSANVDPSCLKTSWNGQDGDTPIPFGSQIGRDSYFKPGNCGDYVVFVIRKGGSVETFNHENFTLNNLYRGMYFSAPGLKYLDVR